MHEHLVLSNLGLESIGHSQKPYLEVRILDFSQNRLTDVAGIQSFPNLQELSLGNNRISDLQALEELTTLHWLESIKLAGNPLVWKYPDYPYLLKKRLVPAVDSIDGVTISQSGDLNICLSELSTTLVGFLQQLTLLSDAMDRTVEAFVGRQHALDSGRIGRRNQPQRWTVQDIDERLEFDCRARVSFGSAENIKMRAKGVRRLWKRVRQLFGTEREQQVLFELATEIRYFTFEYTSLAGTEPRETIRDAEIVSRILEAMGYHDFEDQSRLLADFIGGSYRELKYLVPEGLIRLGLTATTKRDGIPERHFPFFQYNIEWAKHVIQCVADEYLEEFSLRYERLRELYRRAENQNLDQMSESSKSTQRKSKENVHLYYEATLESQRDFQARIPETRFSSRSLVRFSIERLNGGSSGRETGSLNHSPDRTDYPYSPARGHLRVEVRSPVSPNYWNESPEFRGQENFSFDRNRLGLEYHQSKAGFSISPEFANKGGKSSLNISPSEFLIYPLNRSSTKQLLPTRQPVHRKTSPRDLAPGSDFENLVSYVAEAKISDTESSNLKLDNPINPQGAGNQPDARVFRSSSREEAFVDLTRYHSSRGQLRSLEAAVDGLILLKRYMHRELLKQGVEKLKNAKKIASRAGDQSSNPSEYVVKESQAVWKKGQLEGTNRVLFADADDQEKLRQRTPTQKLDSNNTDTPFKMFTEEKGMVPDPPTQKAGTKTQSSLMFYTQSHAMLGLDSDITKTLNTQEGGEAAAASSPAKVKLYTSVSEQSGNQIVDSAAVVIKGRRGSAPNLQEWKVAVLARRGSPVKSLVVLDRARVGELQRPAKDEEPVKQPVHIEKDKVARGIPDAEIGRGSGFRDQLLGVLWPVLRRAEKMWIRRLRICWSKLEVIEEDEEIGKPRSSRHQFESSSEERRGIFSNNLDDQSVNAQPKGGITFSSSQLNRKVGFKNQNKDSKQNQIENSDSSKKFSKVPSKDLASGIRKTPRGVWIDRLNGVKVGSHFKASVAQVQDFNAVFTGIRKRTNSINKILPPSRTPSNKSKPSASKSTVRKPSNKQLMPCFSKKGGFNSRVMIPLDRATPTRLKQPKNSSAVRRKNSYRQGLTAISQFEEPLTAQSRYEVALQILATRSKTPPRISQHLPGSRSAIPSRLHQARLKRHDKHITKLDQ